MSEINTAQIQCPYCWETVEMDIGETNSNQTLVEDCHVCCRPVLLKVNYTNNTPQVTAERENE